MTPRALMLSPELPYPLQGGGALRTASLLHYLAQHHTVDLILFRHLDSQAPLESLPSSLVDRVLVLELPRHSRSPALRALRNARRLLQGTPPLLDRFKGFEPQISNFLQTHRYRVAIVEHFWCAPYHAVLARHTDHVILNLHNIESELHRSESRVASSTALGVAHRRFASLYRSLEQRWLPRYSEVLTASAPDRDRIQALAPSITVFPNAVPSRPIPDVPEEEIIAFSGNFDYHPNQTAVAWFGRRVWPALAQAHPALRWRLIGMNPESIAPLIRDLPRVECTGAVQDAVPELARARAVVVPLLSGSGTRLKIVEAWAAARAVISTPIGAEGLPLHALTLAESEGDFVGSVSRVLADSAMRHHLGRSGRACYEQSLTWDAAWRSLGNSRMNLTSDIPL